MEPIRIIIAAALALGIAGCAATSPKTKSEGAAAASTKQEAKASAAAEKKSMAAPDTQITTEEQYRAAVVGKRWVGINNASNWAVNHADGRLTGDVKDKKLTGAWTWEGAFYCRTAKWGEKDLGMDCQKVVLDGDILSVTRKKGEGKTSKWRLAE